MRSRFVLVAIAVVGAGLLMPAGSAVAAGSTITGVVTVAGGTEPAVDVSVFATGPELFATSTDATGRYTFAGIPAGEYDVVARPRPCLTTRSGHVNAVGTVRLDLALPQRIDPAGYTCRDIEQGTFVAAGNVLPLSGNDASVSVPLPFAFRLYGQTYTGANVSTNGLLSLTAPSTLSANTAIPTVAAPNAAIYPFWDNLTIRSSSSIRTATLGTAPNRRFVVEWRSMAFSSYQFAGARVTFEAVLNENGQLLFQYEDINPGWEPNNQDARAEQGGLATIGIENATGSTAFQYTYNTRTLHSGGAILFRP